MEMLKRGLDSMLSKHLDKIISSSTME